MAKRSASRPLSKQRSTNVVVGRRARRLRECIARTPVAAGARVQCAVSAAHTNARSFAVASCEGIAP